MQKGSIFFYFRETSYVSVLFEEEFINRQFRKVPFYHVHVLFEFSSHVKCNVCKQVLFSFVLFLYSIKFGLTQAQIKMLITQFFEVYYKELRSIDFLFSKWFL